MKETKKCPYCGEEILAGAKKCKHCGEWLEKEKIHCPVCQEEIDKDATECPFCHENLQKGREIAERQANANDKALPESEVVKTNRSFFTTYFWNPIRHQYADFKGRTSKKEFWMFFWFYFGFLLFFSLHTMFPYIGMRNIIVSQIADQVSVIAFSVFFLLTIIPSAAITIRRLNDCGKRKYRWVYFVFLACIIIPVPATSIFYLLACLLLLSPIFGIWLLVLLCQPTQNGIQHVVKCRWKAFDTIFFVVVGLLLIFGIVRSSIRSRELSDLNRYREQGAQMFEAFLGIDVSEKIRVIKWRCYDYDCYDAIYEVGAYYVRIKWEERYDVEEIIDIYESLDDIDW